MKKLFKFLSLAMFFAVFSSLSSNAATITVPAGATVTVPNWVSDEYIVHGTLISNTSTGFGAALTVKPGGKVIINGKFSAYNPQITVEVGGEITATSLGVQGSATYPFTIHGKVTISGDAIITGYLHLYPGGVLSATNINFSNPNNLIAGTVKASESVMFNNATNTMDCGLIYTKNFINVSGPNPLTGTGYIKVTGNFISGNALTTSSTIILDLPGGTVPSGQNKGAATLGTQRPCVATPLPVTFDAVNAFVTNNSLTVSWNTLNETNNNHFEIEVSKDGRNFTKIGEVKSAATNGNSASNIEYTFTHQLPAGAIAGGLAVILLAGGTMMYNRRKKYVMLSILSLAFLSVTLFSCSKSDYVIENSNDESVFVRIIQVDIDGKTASSKIVKALIK